MPGYKGYKEKVYSLQDGANILLMAGNLKACLSHLENLIPSHYHFVLREYSVYYRRLRAKGKIIQKLPSGQEYLIRKHKIKKKFNANDLREK